MKTARFSIITCTLNAEPWLAESIASVLSQRGVDIEYLFVDGGSTDGTLARIQSLPLPTTLLQVPARGIAHAMNAGLAAATGEIVAFLHADDFYLGPDVLATVSQAFEQSQCRWLYGRIQSVQDGVLVPESFHAPRFSRAQLLRGNFIPHPACFVQRSLLFQVGGFDVRLKYAMDYELWLRLAPLAQPLELGVALSAFREHEGSLSTRKRGAAMREDLCVRLRALGFDPVATIEHLARYGVRRTRSLWHTARQRYA
jgi:glycosyltransferase involved in cell wall biosynthesis